MHTDASPDESGAPQSADRRHFLIVYATRYGSTKGVAEAIAEELRDAGQDVDVQPAVEASDLSRYDAVVVAGRAKLVETDEDSADSPEWRFQRPVTEDLGIGLQIMRNKYCQMFDLMLGSHVVAVAMSSQRR